MEQLIRERVTKRCRKDYYCEATEWAFVGCGLRDFNGMGLSISEWRALIEAKNSNGKISKGEPLLRQTLVDNGELRTFVAKPEIHAICVKYNLYP